jgi:hypothetical protein
VATNKTLRNLPSILHLCEQHSNREWRTPAEWRKVAKDAFNSQTLRPLLSYEDELNPVNRLLLMHDIDSSVLDELQSECPDSYDPNTIHATESLAMAVVGISANCNYTFGTNTFFQNRERDIVDALKLYSRTRLNSVAESFRERCSKNPEVGFFIAPPGLIRNYLHTGVPASANIGWMEMDAWETKIRVCPPSVTLEQYNLFKPDYDLLAAAWISRNPDNLDPRVVSLASRIDKLFSDARIARKIHAYYEELLDKCYQQYTDTYLPGKPVTVCVRYNDEAQLQAMLPLLSPETRYPLDPSDPEGCIKRIPELKVGDTRTSYHILHSLWNKGAVFDDIQIFDSKTLLCRPRPGARFSCKGFAGLSFDATDLAKKLESKKPVKGDGDPHYKKRFPHAVVIGDEPDEWLLTFTKENLKVHVMSRPKIREFASGCNSSAELALKFASVEGNNLMKKEFKSATDRANRRGQFPDQVIR